MRWLFHVAPAAAIAFDDGDRYAPASLATEGFLHASYRDLVLESARLYFSEDADLRVLVVDPRLLDVPVRIATTPRGPMPHIHGSIPRAAARVIGLADVVNEADAI